MKIYKIVNKTPLEHYLTKKGISISKTKHLPYDDNVQQELRSHCSEGKIGIFRINTLGVIILGSPLGKKINIEVPGAPLNIGKLIQIQIV